MNRSEQITSTRRSFLKTAAAAAPAVMLPTTVFGSAMESLSDRSPLSPRALSQEPLFRISLAQWSLHRTLRAGDLDALEFAQTARNDYGIEAIEYVNTFFREYASDTSYLTELKNRAADHGVKSLLIMVDGEGALGAVDDGQRTQAVENHYRWVEAAKFLGCHSIRVNASSEGSPEEQRMLVADGLSRLVEFADPHEINVIVENHGGLSSNGAWLVSVMKEVDHPRCGTLPDFGNFQISRGILYDRYLGVAELMPYAKAVSAKSRVFDQEGNERETDYLQMMRIVLDAGYHGYVGIEFEGSEVSEPEGIRLTRNLLERVREILTGEAPGATGCTPR